MSATIIPFKANPLPAINKPRRGRDPLTDHYHLLLGMNQRQEGMAHKLSWRAGTHDKLIYSFSDFIEASREFEEALEAYREQLLKALATKCPAAAKRITEGKSPKRRARQSAR
jgi:hypothetical protein